MLEVAAILILIKQTEELSEMFLIHQRKVMTIQKKIIRLHTVRHLFTLFLWPQWFNDVRDFYGGTEMIELM